MIVFDLKCSGDHVFEAWFASSSAFVDQQARGLLMCPVCGTSDVLKAVMAPNIGAKGNQRAVALAQPQQADLPTMMTTPEAPEAKAEAVKAMMKHIAEVQAQAIKTSTWVGKDFEQQARAMDAGEIDRASIHGQATPDQARSMMEDGVSVMPLLIPVVPPDERN